MLEVRLTFEQIEAGEPVTVRAPVPTSFELPPRLMRFTVEEVGNQTWRIVKTPVVMPIEVQEINEIARITRCQEAVVIDLGVPAGRVTRYDFEWRYESSRLEQGEELSMHAVDTRMIDGDEMARLNQEASALRTIQQTTWTAPEQAAQLLADFEANHPDSSLRAGLPGMHYTLARLRDGLARNQLVQQSAKSFTGKPAQDFTLPDLDGREVPLSHLIRGKVALLSFWGCACGPCRAEAPHLTALHRKYRELGFTVIAVNGYDESRAVVKKFADEQRLTHPILVGGGAVARDQYAVSSYPTSFWIDTQGKIIDHQIGFEPGMEVEMEKKLVELLAGT